MGSFQNKKQFEKTNFNDEKANIAVIKESKSAYEPSRNEEPPPSTTSIDYFFHQVNLIKMGIRYKI